MAKPVAKLALVVVFPTPPLPDVTTTIFVMFFYLKNGVVAAKKARPVEFCNTLQFNGVSSWL
jgi:hypothetical protein